MTSLGLKTAPPLDSDFLSRMIRESMPAGQITGGITSPTGYSTNTHQVVTTGSLAEVASYTVALGRAWLVLDLWISADQAAVVYAKWKRSARTGAYTSTYLTDTTAGGGEAVFDLIPSAGGRRSWSFDGAVILPELNNVKMGYMSPVTPGPFLTTGINVIDITNDLQWDAKNVICVAGDSIVRQIPGVSTAIGTDLYPFQIINSLRDVGVSVRQINKGAPGSTSLDGQRFLADGLYDVAYDLLIVSYGMNDAGQGTSQANYTAALNAYITHRNRTRPTADVLILGPSYTDDAARSTIGNYRTWASAVVTAAQTGQPSHVTGGVYYFDLSSVATVPATDFVESAGSRVHPSIAGHVKLAAGVLGAVQTTRFYARVHG